MDRPLGWFYYVFAAVVGVGAGNAVNLPTGWNGLATMPVVIAAAAFLVICYLVRARRASLSGHSACAGCGANWQLCAPQLSGLAFLWFNAPLAAVFMGDTGSLALGRAFGAIAVSPAIMKLCSGLWAAVKYSRRQASGFFWFKRTGRRCSAWHNSPSFRTARWAKADIDPLLDPRHRARGALGLATLKLR
jgi:phospho-N-acetylmuramoyl-pentapeptide-transferase